MTLGIQRGLSSTSPLAEQRRAETTGADAVGKARAVETQTENAVGASAAAAPVDAPKADAATVQGARERALGTEDALRQRLETGGWLEAHHRKGHIGSKA
jgi:hypothetical protein